MNRGNALLGLCAIVFLLAGASCAADPPGPPRAATSPAPLRTASPSAPGSPQHTREMGQDASDQRRTCAVLSANTKFLTNLTSGPANPALSQQISRMRELAAVAPTEIREDIKTVADFDQGILEAASDGRAPDIRETPALTSALAHVVGWVARNCSQQ